MCVDTVNINSNKPVVLLIDGSPHRDGHTHKLVSGFLEGLGEEAHLDHFRAFDTRFSPCDDCGGCHQSGNCVKNGGDGYAAFLQQVRAADFIVFASPVYFLGVPAPVKILIDRTQQLFFQKYVKRQPLDGYREKPGILLATCGAKDESALEIVRRQVKMFFDCVNVRLEQAVLAYNTDENGVDPKQIQIAKEAAGRVWVIKEEAKWQSFI